MLPAFTAGRRLHEPGRPARTPRPATTNITAVEITVDEPSPEGELLRGAHDHQTVYTLHLDNNTVAPTGPLTVEAYLPAGLEFLGCGQADHTTDAPTNPGGAEEWPGSGGLDGNLAAPANCDVPSEVATVSLDPDGAGPLPAGVYTRVRWTGLATLAAGATRDIRYVAADPDAREHDDLERRDADRGKPRPGVEPRQQPRRPHAGRAGAPDLRDRRRQLQRRHARSPTTTPSCAPPRTSASSRARNQGAITDGQLTRWTLAVDTGEYRYVDDIRVTDTVPDGLCPLSSPALSGDADCAFQAGNAPSAPYTTATENASGTWTLLWDSSHGPRARAHAALEPPRDRLLDALAHALPGELQRRSGPCSRATRGQNTVDLLGKDYQRCVAPADCDPVGTKIDTTPGLPAEPDADGTDDVDASSASQSAGSPTIDKTIRAAGGATPVSCGTGTYSDLAAGPYGPGDRICFKLRVDFPALLDTGNPTVTDFLPTGTTFESYTVTAEQHRHDQAVHGRGRRPGRELDARRRRRRRRQRPGLRGPARRARRRPDRGRVRIRSRAT